MKSEADLIRVVRCKDCVYWHGENLEEGDTYGHCRNRYGGCENQQTDMWWFCADGERRDDDGNDNDPA